MNRDEIKAAFPLADQLRADGIELKGGGQQLSGKCPFHKDSTASFTINTAKNTWWCFSCQIGGSIIDYLAKKDGRDVVDVMKDLAARVDKTPPAAQGPGKVVATYTYRNAVGEEVFRVLRYEPKTFRQQKKVEIGDCWVFGMEGVERVLYRLPELLAAGDDPIWLCEGEKDADNLVRFGFCASCNVGGAGKWLDGYSESLQDRDVVLCGDTDKPGIAHVKRMIEALDGKAKRLRVVTVPKPDKDISDYLARFGSLDAGRAAVNELLAKAVVMVQGGTVPILSIAEMEERYIQFISQESDRSYSFAGWLPTFGRRIRPCVPGDVICFLASTGAGKCLGKGTPVIMIDGSSKNVEDIVTGDQLIGPDSKPRSVLGIGTGKEQMFRITPRSGDPFVCNGSHILNLKRTGVYRRGEYLKGQTLNISVNEYLKSDKTFKHQWKLWKSPIQLPETNVTMPPYILGVWLGDGTTGKSELTTGDKEIADAFVEYGLSLGITPRYDKGSGCVTIRLSRWERAKSVTGVTCSTVGCDRLVIARGLCHKCYSRENYNGRVSKRKGNPFISLLESVGLKDEKFIPEQYLKSSTAQRMELLAGLLDTDGYADKASSAVFTNCNLLLAQQVLWLGRSLGFMCSLRKKKTSIKSTGYTGIAYNVSICGDIATIPTRLNRRRPVGKIQRTQRVCGFKVEPLGIGDYYGFELDGDGLFLLGDFTVSHNTAILQNMAINTTLPTLLFEMELADTLTFERFVAGAMRMRADDVERAYMDGQRPEWRESGRLDNVFVCPLSGITPAQVETIVNRAELKMGRRPVLVQLDYVQLMKGTGKTIREEMTSVMKDVKTVAKNTGTIIVVSSQVQRAKDAPPEIGLYDGKETGQIENSASLHIGAWRDPADDTLLWMKVNKNTKGTVGVKIPCNFDGARMLITERETKPSV